MEIHAIRRTSPKGGPFIGTCIKCGENGLTFHDFLHSECRNPKGTTQDEDLVNILEETSMPYFARWDTENAVMVVGGTVAPSELTGFLEALQAAARGSFDAPPVSPSNLHDRLRDAGLQMDSGKQDKPGNWLKPFLWLANRQEHYVRAIRLWRVVTGATLKEAKDYVDALKSGLLPPPSGYGFADVAEQEISPPFVPLEALE